MMTKCFLVATKGGLSYIFGKLSLRAFQKHVACFAFLVIEKLRSPSEKLPQLDGDHVFLSCPSLWVNETSIKGFIPFQSPFEDND
jgi:hypothetical protein